MFEFNTVFHLPIWLSEIQIPYSSVFCDVMSWSVVGG